MAQIAHPPAVVIETQTRGVKLPSLVSEIETKVEDAAREPKTRLRRKLEHQQAVVTHYVRKWKHANTIRSIHKAPIEEKLASQVFSDDPSLQGR